jgi:ABC-type nitrate/sulfonate/bicarbonate transport system substrate-binding protein
MDRSAWLSRRARRAIGTALSAALIGLAGCVGAPPGKVPDSLVSYERTYATALGAMADQKLTFSVQDPRNGRIVGSANGTTISAVLEPQLDGTLRVLFANQDSAPADPGLLKRVVDAYNERLRAAAKLIPPGLL